MWPFSARKNRTAKPVRRYNPRLETFEDRLVPAHLVVTNPTSIPDDHSLTLEQAVESAAAGDIISFAGTAQNVSLESGIATANNQFGGTLTIEGPATISCQSGYIFNFGGNPNLDNGDTFILSNVTLANSPGAIADLGAKVQLDHCTIPGNVTQSYTGTSAPYAAVFSFGHTGGFYGPTTVTIDHCAFINNVGTIGGAVTNFGSVMLVHDSMFSANSADIGGAVYNGGLGSFSQGVLTMENDVLSNNSALERGGAVELENGSATLVSCTFSGNSAPAGADISNFRLLNLVNTSAGDIYNAGSITTTSLVTYEDGLVATLQAQIAALPLSDSQKNLLLKSLQTAQNSLDRSNDNAAINQLSAFINKLNALVNSGRLSAYYLDPNLYPLMYDITLLSDAIS